MMQCVVLHGNLLDDVVLNESTMISNLCVKRKDVVSTDQLRRNRRKEVTGK